MSNIAVDRTLLSCPIANSSSISFFYWQAVSQLKKIYFRSGSKFVGSKVVY